MIYTNDSHCTTHDARHNHPSFIDHVEHTDIDSRAASGPRSGGVWNSPRQCHDNDDSELFEHVGRSSQRIVSHQVFCAMVRFSF